MLTKEVELPQPTIPHQPILGDHLDVGTCRAGHTQVGTTRCQAVLHLLIITPIVSTAKTPKDEWHLRARQYIFTPHTLASSLRQLQGSRLSRMLMIGALQESGNGLQKNGIPYSRHLQKMISKQRCKECLTMDIVLAGSAN